jgi:hypothetical protein
MSTSRKMPSKKSIYQYWHFQEGRQTLLEHNIELENQSDIFGESKIDCFACGDILKIQRCHIIAKTMGGSDDVSNLHLLCTKCHVESEFNPGHGYWIWLKHMLSEEWQELTEHIFKRRVKMGYSEEKLLEAYKKNGVEGMLSYMAYFETESKADEVQFKKELLDKVKRLEKPAKKI